MLKVSLFIYLPLIYATLTCEFLLFKGKKKQEKGRKRKREEDDESLENTYNDGVQAERSIKKREMLPIKTPQGLVSRSIEDDRK